MELDVPVLGSARPCSGETTPLHGLGPCPRDTDPRATGSAALTGQRETAALLKVAEEWCGPLNLGMVRRVVLGKFLSVAHWAFVEVYRSA